MDETSPDEKPKRKKKFAPADPARPQKVAAMLGAGMTQLAISKSLGVDHKTVSVIVHKKIAHDPELQKIRDEARARIGPAAIEVLELNLSRIREALSGPTLPPLAHMASALRELANISGIAKDTDHNVQFRTGPIPTSPEAVAEMVEAVRRHQQSLNQPKDRTHDGERID